MTPSPTTARVVSDDYTLFTHGVRRLCRIDLDQYKRGQMERRLRSLSEVEGHGSLVDYLAALKRDPEALGRMLDRITINVSQLWRNPEQWLTLERHVLPALAADSQRLRAWSAGCSYGAEAYTLAALCRDAIPGTRVEIRGTDIDARMVAAAREGRFSVADARDAPAAAMKRHFESDETGWRARAELRMLVRFEEGDLLRITPRPESYDLILCRNTVIYFGEAVRDALHARFVAALRPGGILVVGSTERVVGAPQLGLTSPHPFVYRRAPS
jgi:chemotaxis protein methyltransferase CheR